MGKSLQWCILVRICGGGLEVVTVEGRKKIDSTVKLEVARVEIDEVTVEN